MRPGRLLLAGIAVLGLWIARGDSSGGRNGPPRATSARTAGAAVDGASDPSNMPLSEPAKDEEPEGFFDPWRAHFGLAGRVLDADGMPVAGARLGLTEGGLDWLDVDPSGKDADINAGVTGPDGSFRIWPVGPWETSLSVYAEGHAHWWEWVAPGDEDLVIRLARRSRPAAAAGHVVFPDGRPAPGATVRGVVCGPSGEFEVRDLEAGLCTLKAECRGHAGFRGADVPVVWSGSVECTLEEGARRTGLVIELACSAVRLRVLGPDSNALSRVHTSISAGPGDEYGGTETDDDGYALLCLAKPPGTKATISVHLEGLTCHEQVARTTALDDPLEVTVRVPAPRRVVFRAKGLPPGVAATFSMPWTVESEPNTFLLWPDEEGWFRAHAPGFVAVPEEGTVPAFATEVEVPFVAAGVVTGRARGASRVQLGVGGPEENAQDDGTFRVEGPPGPATLLVHEGGFVETLAFRTDLVLESGRTIDLGEISLPPVRRVHGRIRTSDGRPAGGTQVVVLARELGRQGYARAQADGRFSIRCRWSEEMRVQLWREGVAPEALLSESLRDPPEEPLEFVLAPAALVRVGDACIRSVRTPDGFEVLKSWVWRPCSCIGLPPGPYSLEVVGDPQSERTVELTSGAFDLR